MFITVVHRVTHRMGYLHRLLGILLHGDLSTPLHLFIQAVIYINMESWIFIFLFWVIAHYIIPASALGSLFSWLLYPFNISTWLWVNFCFVLLWFWAFPNFLSGYRLILDISCPGPRISHFSWFLLLEIYIRSQHLGPGSSCYCGIIASSPRQYLSSS